MAEYIRREDAVKIAERYGVANGSVLGRHSGLADCIANEILNLPTVDVAPVVHGKWNYVHRHRGGFRTYVGVDRSGETHTITVDERMEIDEPYCSVCGKWNESTWLSYCPNCGAKMEGE